MVDEVSSPLLIGVQGAGRYAGVSRDEAYRLTHAGEWGRPVVIGRRILVHRDRVAEWARSQTEPTDEVPG